MNLDLDLGQDMHQDLGLDLNMDLGLDVSLDLDPVTLNTDLDLSLSVPTLMVVGGMYCCGRGRAPPRVGGLCVLTR